MRDFGATRWSPAGSRPHIVVPVPDPVAELAAGYEAHAHAWWAEQGDPRPYGEVFRPTARPYLHLTLAWLDRPTRVLGPDVVDALQDALRVRLGRLDPVPLTVGPGLVGLYAIELYVAPTPAVDALAAAARTALRDVFGPTAAAEPPPGTWCPHIAVLYGRHHADTDALASRLLYVPPPGHTRLPQPVTMIVDQVLLADQDTWGPTGLTWDTGTARTIRLGTAPAR